MSKKLTFSEPGAAKVTWKVQYNDEVLDNSMLDSVVLNVNGIPQELDLSKNSQEIEVLETTNVNMEITYEGVATKTKDLVVEILQDEPSGPSDKPEEPAVSKAYYGSLTIGEGKLWDKGGESETISFLQSLSKDKLESLVDNSPLKVDGVSIAHANSLIISDDINPTNRKYGFFGESADLKVEYAQPIVIYPVALGEVKKITDVMGNQLSINSADKSGFYCSTIVLDGVENYVYVHKVPDSTSETGNPVFINFSK